MTDAVVPQVGGDHYKATEGICPHCRGGIQHWDAAANLPGLEYAATKYVWRHADKDGFEGLKKAISYIEKRMAITYPEQYAEFKNGQGQLFPEAKQQELTLQQHTDQIMGLRRLDLVDDRQIVEDAELEKLKDNADLIVQMKDAITVPAHADSKSDSESQRRFDVAMKQNAEHVIPNIATHPDHVSKAKKE